MTRFRYGVSCRQKTGPADKALRGAEPVVERQMLQSANRNTFSNDITHFAERMARQVHKDWKSFLEAHGEGKLN